MRALYQFFKSTILGGLVILVPVVVLGAIVVWVVNLAVGVIVPVFEWLPDRSVGGVSLAVLAAAGSLLALCFLAGLFAETAIIRGLGNRADRLAMSIPGY